MTISELRKVLRSIKGSSPIIAARRRAIIEQINRLLSEQIGG